MKMKAVVLRVKVCQWTQMRLSLRVTHLLKDVPIQSMLAQILESLYKNGMTGWGRRHSANLEQAVKSTGLDLSQVKVIM